MHIEYGVVYTNIVWLITRNEYTKQRTHNATNTPRNKHTAQQTHHAANTSRNKHTKRFFYGLSHSLFILIWHNSEYRK